MTELEEKLADLEERVLNIEGHELARLEDFAQSVDETFGSVLRSMRGMLRVMNQLADHQLALNNYRREMHKVSKGEDS